MAPPAPDAQRPPEAEPTGSRRQLIVASVLLTTWILFLAWIALRG